VVTVGQLKDISIKTPEKVLQSVKSSANKRKWAGLSKRSVALLRAKSDRCERSDRGEKERGTF